MIGRRLGRPAGRLARAAALRSGLSPARRPRVFCIAMQRCGTTSFGNFCEQELGLARRGFYHSISNEWTRAWVHGDYERIFRSADFRTGEVFEDDPWWCPGFYEVLAARFPEAKFVLITRDPDRWFRSLQAHSGGRTPGHTDLHAAIYGRREEFRALLGTGIPFRKANWQGLSLEGRDAHYKAHFLTHAERARAFFAGQAPGRFLELDLDDAGKFGKLAEFLGFPARDYPDIHANAIASAPGRATAGPPVRRS